MYNESYSIAIQGIEGCVVHIEADVSDGLPMFNLVGFLTAELKEAKERVRIALKNTGFKIPPKRITVNLSPADLRKDGTGYDLSIAIALLQSFDYLQKDHITESIFLGELSFEGRVIPVPGCLPMIYTAKKAGFKYAFVPVENFSEASMVSDITIIGISCLSDVITCLTVGIEKYLKSHPMEKSEYKHKDSNLDFKDIHGQKAVKRAIEIAVAGRHNLLLIGPPGSGKTMMAKRIPEIMPELTPEEQMEISMIYSVAGLLSPDMPIITRRPFRSPHHNTTEVALTGGGRYPKPGECSLSSGGVLFLDELPEFPKKTIEVLRQPMEDRYINVTRLEGNYRYPANFQLVAAANPCLCGYYPDRKKCKCTPFQIANYFGKISKPILDRIDICAKTTPLNYPEMLPLECHTDTTEEESTQEMRKRIIKVRDIQIKRYEKETYNFNAELTSKGVEKYCKIDSDGVEYMREIYKRLGFTARGCHKILKVSRTIADIEESESIQKRHLAEAVCYRIFE